MQSDLTLDPPNAFFRTYYSIVLSLNWCNPSMQRMIPYKNQEEEYFSLNKDMVCYSEGMLQ